MIRRNVALIPSLLGSAFDALPEAVRRIHDGAPHKTARGRANVDRTRGFWPWLICSLAGLPVTGRDMPVTVTFTADGSGREQWNRQFASRCYASRMAAARHVREVAEHFGPFTLFHALTVEPNGLRWIITSWRLLGIPLPSWSIPSSDAFESEDNGRFTFDIEVSFPLVGPVISYRGWLAPAD